MQLRNSLYEIASRQDTADGGVAYELTLHADHVIYRAHFPSLPVTPGVCLVQMACELLEDDLARPLQIVRVKNVKFLSVVSPVETPHITCTLRKIALDETDGSVSMQAQITADDRAMAKISMVCR